jgi:hypothetical protein
MGHPIGKPKVALRIHVTGSRPSASYQYDDGEAFQDVPTVRGIRWARTGVLNAKGQPILKRLDKPIGFWANHDEPVYAIEDLD